MLTLSCLYHYGPPQRSSVDGSHSCRWLPVSLRLRTSCGHWSRPEGPGNHCLRNGLRPWSPELDNTHSSFFALLQKKFRLCPTQSLSRSQRVDPRCHSADPLTRPLSPFPTPSHASRAHIPNKLLAPHPCFRAQFVGGIH